MNRIILILLALLTPIHANADVITDVQINWLRIHSTFNPIATGLASVKVTKDLPLECYELVVPKDDAATLSVLLSAKAKSSTVDIHYHNVDNEKPWSNGCWITIVTEK